MAILSLIFGFPFLHEDHGCAERALSKRQRLNSAEKSVDLCL
jgi:hypothetical protein